AGLDWILSEAEDERRIETGRQLDAMTVDLLNKWYAAKQASEADRTLRLAVIQQLQTHCENSQRQATELIAKEAVIQTLQAELATQHATLLQAQREQLADREAISRLKRNETMAQQALDPLRQDLEAKELVIQAQHRALVAQEAVIQQLEAFRRAALHTHWC